MKRPTDEEFEAGEMAADDAARREDELDSARQGCPTPDFDGALRDVGLAPADPDAKPQRFLRPDRSRHDRPGALFGTGAQDGDPGQPVRQGRSSWNHPEAFCLMLYGAPVEGPTRRENWPHWWVWNTRDGVTPFVVTIEGHELHHAKWELDFYAPRHRPAAGDWVFRDMTRQGLEWSVRRRVAALWARNVRGIRNHYPDPTAAVQAIVDAEFRPGLPELHQVRLAEVSQPPETQISVPAGWRARLHELNEDLQRLYLDLDSDDTPATFDTVSAGVSALAGLVRRIAQEVDS